MVEQAVGPALRDRSDLGRGDREEVAGEPDRGAVEVAAGLDPSVGEDHRVVDRRAELVVGDPERRARRCRGRRRGPGACSGSSRRPARAGSSWRWLATIAEPSSSARRLAALSAWPGCGRRATRSAAKARSVPSSASVVAAAVTSAAASRPRRSARARTSMPRIPSVPLISARPSLGPSTGGSIPAAASAGPAGAGSPFGSEDLPLAEHRQRAGGERCEIAAGPQRAVLGDDRIDAGVEHRQHRLGQQRPGAGAAHRQRPGPQEEHRADDLALDRRSHPRRVGADQRPLQLGPAILGDRRVGEGAEAGRDAVGGLVGGGDPLDDRRRLLHRRPRLVGQASRGPAPGDGDDVVGLHPVRAQIDGCDGCLAQARTVVFRSMVSAADTSRCVPGRGLAALDPARAAGRHQKQHPQSPREPAGGREVATGGSALGERGGRDVAGAVSALAEAADVGGRRLPPGGAEPALGDEQRRRLASQLTGRPQRGAQLLDLPLLGPIGRQAAMADAPERRNEDERAEDGEPGERRDRRAAPSLRPPRRSARRPRSPGRSG